MNPVAAHLAVAVERHRRWCRDNGEPVPADLFALVAIVTGSQQPSKSLADIDPGDDAGVPLAVDYSEAGRLLGVSPSSIYRLVRDGKLRAVTVGAAKRVPRAELERYIADQLASSARGGSA